MPSSAYRPARELAQAMIQIYREHFIPEYVAHFEKAGFSKLSLVQDPSKLFQMVLLAFYDRRPFTRVARGWEPIWGIRASSESLPAVLREAGLFDLKAVLGLNVAAVSGRLQGKRFFNYRIDTDGAHTVYAKTFTEAGHVVTETLHKRIVGASTERDVKAVFDLFDSVHGIGLTIASKLVKYTLREIGVGSVPPSGFARVVEPLLNEYHNAKLAKELELRHGPGTVKRLFKELCELGDPYAIDVLYYVSRDRPDLRTLLLG